MPLSGSKIGKTETKKEESIPIKILTPKGS